MVTKGREVTNQIGATLISGLVAERHNEHRNGGQLSMSGNETKTESASAQPQTEVQNTQDLSKVVIEYLSNEIQTTTTNMMVYRSKIAFAVFLGPFLLLVAVVANANNLKVSFDTNKATVIGLGVGWCACFLILAYMNARIEQQAWRQCNRWREAIAEIHNAPLATIQPTAFRDDLYKKERRTRQIYVIAYLVLLISFILSILILFSLRS